MRTAAPATTQTPPPAVAPTADRPAAATVTRSAPAAPSGRGIQTDYGYVVSELRRIFVLTAGILLLLLVIALIL